MSTLLRWQIAAPFIVFPLLFLAATVGGGYILWSLVDDPAWRALTLFMCLMYVICLGIGISIGIDRGLDSFPWRRMLTVVVFLVLSLGVHWVREMIQTAPSAASSWM
ncbi:hypothetical protein Aca07nite_78630 [Actinoplanes capillaceus]|uniref:Uncharacterized protein n=1 Tax=Actinoplanes campanulatus TaxID=113559 RepID=A0ABQ3WWM2_9ACTN|nr:hypothetical protein [Actinoplanes capillaceus]GID50588.1 hypothetical protein Aca07nite_78630 [Actinoplanes capillaceus]